MNRRGFLASCLALAAAPAIVRADSLMRIVPRDDLLVALERGFVGDRFTIEGVAGIFRVTTAFDPRGPNTVARLDTTNGETQWFGAVDYGCVVDSDFDQYLSTAVHELTKSIEREHGSLDGFRAPPVYDERNQWVLK